MALEQVTVEYNLALEKAKAQFNGLVQTIQQGEQKITNSSKQANNQILSDEQKAHNKRVQFIKEETQDLAELQKRKKLAYSPEDISAYNKRIAETQQRIKTLNGETGNLVKSNSNLITSFKNIAGAVGIAFGVQQLLSFGKELIDIGYKSRGVSKAFNAIATSKDLAALQASTGFSVSDLQLKQLTVRANMFKISLNTLPSLLKFATVRAAETGQEVDYLVNSIIDGIGRQSPLILDNLGLSAIDVRTEFKKTGDMATAVANIIERDMANSVTSIDDATNSVQRLNAKFDNFKEAAGTVVVKKLDEISTILAADISWTDRFTASLNYLGQANPSLAILRLIGDNEKLAKTIIETEAALAKYNKEIQNTLIVTGDTETKIQQLVQILTMLDNLVLSNAEGFGFAALAVQHYEKQLNSLLNQAPVELTETLKGLNEELSALKEQFENTDINSPIFRTLQQQIKDLEARIESITNPTNKGSIAALEAEISRLSEKQKQLNTTTEASIEKYAQLQTKINELQRNISELKRLGDPLEKFNIERIGDDIEVSKKQLKDLESIMEGIADKTLTASQMLKKFDDEIKNLKKSTGDASIGGFLTEDTIKKQEEFNSILTSSVTTLVGDLTGLFNAIGQQQDDAINRQLEGERTRAQEHFDIMKTIWQQQLESGQITKEEQFNQEVAYTEKINALEAKQAEVRRQQLRKQAIAEKANASFQLIIGTATSVAKNLANPPAIIAILALAAAQLAIIAATPIPEFAKGVVGLQGEGTETSDSIHAKLSKGESVITAKATRANKDALTAMNNGEYEKFVQQKYIMPALEVKREKQRNSFAESISRSMQSGTYDDSLLIHETRKNKQVSIRNADQIGKATARELGRNSYFKNRV
jgi:hypothetical protein